MNLFAPRWKRFAAWPFVILCRLQNHKMNTGHFYCGDDERCSNCGDFIRYDGPAYPHDDGATA